VKRNLSIIAFLLITSPFLLAHDLSADYLRSTGKIYVVFAVILSIFAGLIAFMIWMERRINRIEKQINPS
jgi:predicted tellurium resistance membrane protein TerC